MERLSRLADAASGIEPNDLTQFRERFARPVLEELLGFRLDENPDEPRIRPLSAAEVESAPGPPVALVLLCPDHEELESRRMQRQLEDSLVESQLDYGFVISPEVLRLIRRPGCGPRGAAFDLALAIAAELLDVDSLVAAHRVLAAPNFAGVRGERTIDLVESESRRHSAKVSTDLKSAVFEAAERISGGFLEDVRERAADFDPTPEVTKLRDAGFLALYRILFILYAEARDERLIGHRLYQRSYSLDSIVNRLLRSSPETWARNRHGLWFQLVAVFRIFNEGIANLPGLDNIPPRGGRLFSNESEQGRLLTQLRLSDRDTAAILLGLATTRPRRGVGRERVSFRELEIEQLGSVYEGLLEYEPAEAGETLIECNVGGREMTLRPEEVVRLAELKSLNVRGDAAIVAGTAAAPLHPDAAEEQDEDELEVEEEDSEEDDGEEGTAEPAVARGSTLRLVRRLEPGAFFFKPGSARKSSGSYYTPTPMVDDLVRHALGPLVDGRPAADIERLRVIDIACGSAHFLVGAARFLGAKLFEAYRRESGGTPPPAFHPDRRLTPEIHVRWDSEGEAWCKRRIVERCLFGVDLNPDAVQLAQVALWIESLAGDRPVSFFAHHIRCGNSLLGSWLDRLDAPPDPQLGKRNDQQTRGLFEAQLRERVKEALAERRLIDAPLPPEVRADTPQEYDYKEDRLRRAERAVEEARLLLDLRSACPLLPAIWREMPALLSAMELEREAALRPWWKEFVALRARERFFHWELEFPEVFIDTQRPGFDAVLGNPPWDKVMPTKQEFYGQVDPLIGAFKGNELERRIRELNTQMPQLAQQFAAYRERATTIARVLRGSGDFPLAEARSQAAHEDLSKYFVDRALGLTAKGGSTGLVVPSVLYNGDGWLGIRRYLLKEASITRFYGFENRQKIFPIHSSYKFVNLVARKDQSGAGRFTAAFMRHDVVELLSDDPKPWEVQFTAEEVELLSPETLAFLEFRSARDQEIVRKMYAGRPTLGGDGPGNWGVRLISWRAHEMIFNSSEDKDLMTDPVTGKLWSPALILGDVPPNVGVCIARMRERGYWPVFEGKHVDQFLVGIKPIRWWISVSQAKNKYDKDPISGPTLVFRETASNTNERTCIAAVMPSESVGAHTLTGITTRSVDTDHAAVVLNSLCFDYALRLRTAGIHVSFTYMHPMPVPTATDVACLPKLPTRLAWDAGIGHVTEDKSAWPALWDANRAVAEAYGLDARDMAHILASFPGVARKRPEFHAFLQARLAEWNR